MAMPCQKEENARNQKIDLKKDRTEDPLQKIDNEEYSGDEKQS